jgi:aryl-alcohol dehydrogenase-like predicted oxidoreductase
MNYRIFPKFEWPLAEVGFGTWGMGGWSGADDRQSAAALDRAVGLGCNIFDTAWAYGDGRSERLLGEMLRRHRDRRLFVATKVPPKNRQWPGRASTPAGDVFPADHVIEYARGSAANLGVDTIDLLQLHVWDDSWTTDDGWKRAVDQLKSARAINAFGISVNRWEPENILAALATGLVDAVQVVYNVFDQAPEDVLFPECRKRGVAVFARVPFDEGSLTGTLTADARWPEGDWRNLYFAPPKLAATLARVEPLRVLAAGWKMTLPELALRFILSNPTVSTVIPGMRSVAHVDANLRVSDAPPLSGAQLAALRAHRWDRTPDSCP